MRLELQKKLLLYQVTAVMSVVFALVGFSYNVWRMEVTEENSNIRTACFEILTELSELEQLIYAAHYDNDAAEGSPRKGWVKVGLINDLSVLTAKPVVGKAGQLKAVWSENWNTYASQEASVDNIVRAIDQVREEIKRVLSTLE